MDKKLTGFSFLKNTMCFSIPVFISAVISFFAMPIITRVFTPAEVGKINIFAIHISLFSSLVCLGYDQAYVRFYYEPPLGSTSKNTLGWFLSFSMMTSSILFLMAMPFYNLVAQLVAGETGILILICLVISIAGSVVTTYAKLTYRMETNILMFSVISIVSVFVSKVSYVLAAFIRPTFDIAIIVMSAGQLICAFLFYFMIRTYIDYSKRISMSQFKILSSFAFPIIPSMLLSVLNNSVSQLMLKQYCSFAMIGIYSSGVAVANIISLLQSGFNTYWTAFVWKNYKEEQKKIQQVHHLITYGMVLFALLIILSQNGLYLLIGEKFRDSRYFFPILLISPILYTISETIGLGIGISKKTYYLLWITGLTLITNIGLCMILIPLFGLTGAASASACAAFFRMLLYTYIGERFYKCIDNLYKPIYSIIILVIACIGNMVFFENYVIKSSLIIVLIIIISYIYKIQLKIMIIMLKIVYKAVKIKFNRA